MAKRATKKTARKAKTPKRNPKTGRFLKGGK